MSDPGYRRERKSEFSALMNDFVADGGCIIMVSSELPEMLGVADRIIVMRKACREARSPAPMQQNSP